MMTENPGIISGYDKYIGRIEEGLRADITIIKKNDSDPYKSLLKANNEDVNCVLIDGQPLYGTLSYYQKFDKGNDYEIFKIGEVEKAIDITEEGLEKGEQTFSELMNILTKSFEELKKIFPWEYKRDIDDYCKLAPLYWPKHTSYKNLMYISVMGKGSENTDNSFGKSAYGKDRDFDARDKMKELKANAKDGGGDDGEDDDKPKKKSKKPKRQSGKRSKKSYDGDE